MLSGEFSLSVISVGSHLDIDMSREEIRLAIWSMPVWSNVAGLSIATEPMMLGRSLDFSFRSSGGVLNRSR